MKNKLIIEPNKTKKVGLLTYHILPILVRYYKRSHCIRP